ncbi:hypothetical protein LSTR_LSTR016630 [Laodelphax striatellus]|uniref:Uncharacterized protein n=1 Tax=Laodelphax striatellus TaxID=195883 RepID=A0A482XGV8_LAOST|nr:hypothetical protein LSTR_LSTR016630 [Laodelphax striatellus]
MHPPISPSKVGNCQTDMVSLGSEFFVIDRQGRMEDGEGGNKRGLDRMGNLERRNGVEERKIVAEEKMEGGAKGNGDEGGNKGGLDGMENLKRRGEEERKIVAREAMEDCAKGNGDDCEGGNKGGLENLKRRNFYKKRKRFSAKLAKEENIVNAKMYRERKRKKKNKRKQTLIDRQGKMKEDVGKRNGDNCEGGKTKENGMKNLKRKNVNEYGNKGTVYKTRAMLDWEWFVRSVQKK